MLLNLFYVHFVPDQIRLPTQQQAEKEAQLMHRISGFPPIGFMSIDGTLVKCTCSHRHSALYTCRKFYHSLNVMMGVGPSTTVYYCDAANPGSFHDNYVLKNSPIYQKYERGELPFEGACVLGDSGYENFREWLITPFPENTTDPDEIRFNIQHTLARSTIEQGFGRMKNKWRIILKGAGGLRFLKPIEAGKCTMVCAALWNFVLHREGIQDEHNDSDYPEAPVLGRELPLLPPMNLENRVPTREKVLEFYHKQMGY